jgi:Divergent InlB B-repeat domain
MQVLRTGNNWRVAWSKDGTEWFTSDDLQFDHLLNVTKVGAFIGNAGNNNSAAPAFSGVIDYVFNRATPINPEDGKPVLLPIYKTGQGNITKTPLCGSPVTLTAVPVAGWTFSGWGGRLTGNASPVTLNFAAGDAVTAVFTEDQYNITQAIEGQGAIQMLPQKDVYLYNEVITFTAVPKAGWLFQQWGGNLTGTDNPNTMVIKKDRTVKAIFVPQTFVLTTGVTGQGFLAKAPSKETYTASEVVVLSAIPETGWTFTGWSGALSGDANPTTLQITGPMNVTANFSQTPFQLSATVVGSGEITVTPNQASYANGSQVQVQATAASGWFFLGWSGDLAGNTNPATVTMGKNNLVTAIFSQSNNPNQYILSVALEGNGTVARTPDKPIYTAGEQVSLTATPDVGWGFTGWDGDVVNSDVTINVTMNDDQALKAIFARKQYALTIQPSANGHVDVQPQLPIYEYGDQVALTAVPDEGYRFEDWITSSQVVGAQTLTSITADNPLVVTITNNLNYEAKFVDNSTPLPTATPLPTGFKTIFLPLISRQ